MHAPAELRQRKERIAALIYEKRKREERELQADLGERGSNGEPPRPGGLMHFIRYFWHILEPTTPLVEGWVMQAIALHLEAITRGEIKRCVINVPPGFCKSLMVNVFWPAWEWSAAGLTSTRYVTFSYGAHLTLRDNAKFRDLVQNYAFQELWGDVVKLKKAGEVKPENDATGWKFASSVGGIGTGERGGRVLCDDLHSVRYAESEQVRGETVRWVREGMSNRLNSMINDVILGIGQRVHEDDASAAMLEDEDYVHLCYDDKTEVLTRGGWVRFPDLERGQEVFTVDPRSLNAQWEVPTNYIKLPFNGDLIHYKSTAMDLAITQDHRMVYKDYNDWKTNKTTDWRVLAAKDLPNHFYVPQAVRWASNSEPVCFGGRLWEPNNFAQFMGWYLSEGCTSVKACNSRIVQNVGRNADDIETVLRGSPFSFTKTIRNDGRQVVFNVWGKHLAAALMPLGDSHTKCVPQEVLGLPPEFLRVFVLTFAKGDGCAAGRYGTGTRMSSRSKALIDGLQECCVKAGWASSVQSYEETMDREFNGYIMPKGVMWHLYLRYSKAQGQTRKWYAKIRKANVGTLPYHGYVYCVSVPSTALVVRRNGRVTVSGNCVPMEYDTGRHCATKIGWQDPRTEDGELAWPERFPKSVVEKLRKTLGPYAYSAQYQQAPTPRGGAILKREWWQLWSEEDYPPCYFKWASADTAYTEKEENDPTGFTVWGMFDIGGQPNIILMDAWRKRLELHIAKSWYEENTTRESRHSKVLTWQRAAMSEYRAYQKANMSMKAPCIHPDAEPWRLYIETGLNNSDRWPDETYEMWRLRTQEKWGLCEWLIHSCRRFKVHELLIEGKASGLSVAQELRRLAGNEGWGIQTPIPEGDKTARAYAVQSILSAGLVWAPEREWSDMAISEANGFPKGRYKDVTDSMTQALKYVRDIGLLIRPEERELANTLAGQYRPPSKALYPV